MVSQERRLEPTRLFLFPPFRLDPANEQLWRDSDLLPLRPRTFAVLRYLVANAGRLVTREEFLGAVWPSTSVSEGLLRGYIRDLRDLLGDDPAAPRFIETVPRRGYRFVAAVTAAPMLPGRVNGSDIFPLPILTPPSATGVAGRKAELATLADALDAALRGERQMMFVTGEPGIGKTSLIQAFLRQAVTSGELWIGWGQCVEHHGAGEAYLPVLEALTRLGRGPRGGHLVGLLNRYAPTWLVQMPALVEPAQLDALRADLRWATPERMLREIADALEALTADRPLALVLEDLQWSDPSTVDLIASLAQRPEPARLLLLGTYRPADVIVSRHPLQGIKQELRARGRCRELPLGGLAEAAVTEHLRARGGGKEVPAGLARLVYQHTDGNPLFMVNVVDHLVQQGWIAELEGRWELRAGLGQIEVGVPESLRQMIERQIDRLSAEEQRLLEAASVAGVEFTAATVAAGLGEAVATVERLGGDLARRGQFLAPNGTEEWADGTVAARYTFVHALYQVAWYERLTGSWRAELHRRIGERKAQGYASRAREIAAELARHFEEGREYAKAVEYFERAGENAGRRGAYREAVDCLTRALRLLPALPDTPERVRRELALQVALGMPLLATRGYADPEVEKAYARAGELSRTMGEPAQLFPVLWGLCAFRLARAQLGTALELAQQLVALARRKGDPILLVPAHDAATAISVWRGDLAAARTHAERALTLYDRHMHRALASQYGHDAGADTRCYTAWIAWLCGRPDQALSEIHEALRLARELSHPYTLAVTLNFAALLHQLRREGQAARERAEEAAGLSSEHGFPVWAAFGTMLRGWALADQGDTEEGIAQLGHGLAAFRATGVELTQPYFLALLAEAHGTLGQRAHGLALVSEALAAVDRSGERFYLAELYRLRGELLIQSQRGRGPEAKAEAEAQACFRRATAIAREQGAKSLELRAAMSESRLWQRRTRHAKAREVLAKVYAGFTEGFDTPDLRQARALLAGLS